MASEVKGKTTEAPALQCNQIYCRGQTKAKDFMISLAQLFQGFKLRCYFFALSASWGQKISLCHVTQSLERTSPNISKLRRKVSVIISPLAAPASSLLQVWAPALVHTPGTAGWLLSSGSGLLSIPRWKPWSLFCYLGEFSCASKLQFKDVCHLFWKEVTRVI